MAQSEVGNQLKSQSLGTVIPSAFATVGGRVFPDTNASLSMSDLITVVEAYRATHIVANGGVIPNSGEGYSANPQTTDIAETVVAAADNEVIRLNGASIINAGQTAFNYELRLNDTLLEAGTVDSGAEVPAVLYYPIVVSKGQDLTVTVTSGVAQDCIVNVSAVKTSLS